MNCPDEILNSIFCFERIVEKIENFKGSGSSLLLCWASRLVGKHLGVNKRRKNWLCVECGED